MITKWLLVSILLFASLMASFATPPVPAPRRSPEFVISEPSGKTLLLSSFKGKVVVMEFLFIRSNHCLKVARMLNELQSEIGSAGFQAVGVVFDPPYSPPFNRNVGGLQVSYMVDSLQLKYPVGYATKSDVDSYLGRTGGQILNIPQVVVIDRGG